MTKRLLQTGLNLRLRGEEGLASLIFAQIPEELADRNRLMENRLYPVLATPTHLIAENRRLERLAREMAWTELAEALDRQLERESEARHICSLRAGRVAAI